MKVLVDTSVWSLAFRRGGPADHVAVDKLTTLLDRGADIVLTSVVLQEILQGFRGDASFDKVARHLEPFPLLPLVRDDYVLAALETIIQKRRVSITRDWMIAATPAVFLAAASSQS